MRRQKSSKSETCPELTGVYLADISVKEGAHYPGKISGFAIKLAPLRGGDDEAGEVSRDHSRSPRD